MSNLIYISLQIIVALFAVLICIVIGLIHTKSKNSVK
jgi:hypothetical protein